MLLALITLLARWEDEGSALFIFLNWAEEAKQILHIELGVPAGIVHHRFDINVLSFLAMGQLDSISEA